MSVVWAGEEGGEELFPRLQHAMVQPEPAPPPGSTGATATSQIAFRHFLGHLQHMKERSKVPLEVLPPYSMPKPMPGMDPYKGCILRVKYEWMERIEADGAGCWEEGRRHARARAAQTSASH